MHSGSTEKLSLFRRTSPRISIECGTKVCCQKIFLSDSIRLWYLDIMFLQQADHLRPSRRGSFLVITIQETTASNGCIRAVLSAHLLLIQNEYLFETLPDLHTSILPRLLSFLFHLNVSLTCWSPCVLRLNSCSPQKLVFYYTLDAFYTLPLLFFHTKLKSA